MHQRVEEGGKSLLRTVGVEIRAQQGRVLGRHALHDEEHHVAPLQIDGRGVCGLMHGCESGIELLRREVFAVGEPAAAAYGPQDAEGVAQYEIRPGVVRGVERGVREGDRARHAGEAAAGAAEAEPGRQQQNDRTARIVGPPAPQQALFADAASVAPDEQRREQRPQQYEIPVLGHEGSDELQRVVVVGEEDLVGREALLRIAEIDRIGEVQRDDQRIDRHIVPEGDIPVPAPFAQMQRQE